MADAHLAEQSLDLVPIGRAVAHPAGDLRRPSAARGVAAALVAPSAWYQIDEERLSLAFRPDTPYEAWERETTGLLLVARGIQWLVGDALAYGEDAFPDRYSQVFDPDQYSYNSVTKMARTARSIPPDRRRADIAYSVHEVVAPLPEASQERLLDQARAQGSTVLMVREEARRERSRLDREDAERRPVPSLRVADVGLAVADATRLPIPDESVSLIVTSPPYGLDSSTTAKYRVPDGADEWPELMAGFCREAYRVLADPGRLLVNVPLDTTTGGFRPTYAFFLMAALAAGFRYRTSIVWADDHLRKSIARGSIDSPGGINVVAPCELVAVLHKGPYVQPPYERTGDLTHDEWLSWTNGLWPLSGEGRGWEGFEAAYPLELPLRLLKVFSFREDLICDPFLGSGTTALAAYELRRRFVGFDLDPLQVASSARRLARASGRPSALRRAR